MPTTVTKTIGATSSPTTPDYTTLAAWFAGCPANLVTADQVWEGQCLDQGEFTGTGNLLNVTGITVDATRFVRLTCASGASFKDKAGVRSTALTYNASNGVAIRRTTSYTHTITCSVDYTQFVGLQVSNDESSGADYALNITAGVNTVIASCVLRGGTGGRIANVPGVIKNTLCIGRAAAQLGVATGASTKIYGCTIVSTTASSSSAVFLGTNGTVVQNTGAFGYTNFSSVATAAGSDYNATDLSSASTGTHNQTSLTFASQFTNNASDFRAASGGGLHHGTPDATNLATDITGTARDATTPWIGCWEVVASGAIAGVCDIAFSATDTISGSGTLAGVAANTFGGTDPLTGSGSLAGVAANTFGGTDPLTASGSLTGQVINTFGGTDTIQAGGTLLGSSAVVFGGTDTIGGGGSLIGSSILAFGGTDSLVGSGVLAGSSVLVFIGLGGTGGTVLIAGAIDISVGAVGALTGVGSLLGAVSLISAMTGVVGGTAGLVGTINTAFSLSGVSGGSGELTGTAIVEFTGAAHLNTTVPVSGGSSLSFSLSGTVIGQLPPGVPLVGIADIILTMTGAPDLVLLVAGSAEVV